LLKNIFCNILEYLSISGSLSVFINSNLYSLFSIVTLNKLNNLFLTLWTDVKTEFTLPLKLCGNLYHASDPKFKSLLRDDL